MNSDAVREVLTETALGTLRGTESDAVRVYLGVPFARAERFAYAEPVQPWEGVLEAVRPGPACPQNRAVHEHLEDPTRRFYKREYREGLDFTYGEDCLNVNIYAPADAHKAPVILFFYGGGFDSGINWESPFDGTALAKRGIVTVFANYRVGPLGYLTHAEIFDRYGRDGNFGLDDQLAALRWVREHIASFGGDGDNVTLMGQSAGAISVQYLCLSPAARGLFRRAVMLSGAGLFPKFALPRRSEDTREYWLQFMELANCRTLDELKNAPLDALFDAVEKIKTLRRDTIYCTMPVVDGALLPDRVDALIRAPAKADYWIGYTNADMYAPVMAWIGNRFARQNGGYVCYFDLDAPGDDNRAFHSSDLRYLFGTLDKSWRPYGERDHRASEELLDYLAAFARTGDPNAPGLPRWKKAGGVLGTRVLRVGPGGTRMGRADYLKLTRNFLRRGDPIG